MAPPLSVSSLPSALDTSEERLRRILSTSHCLLWEALVREVPTTAPSSKHLPFFAPQSQTTLDWDFQIVLPHEVHRWLPISWPEGMSFEQAYYDACPQEDHLAMDATSREALNRNAPSYEQSYRLRLATGSIVWIQESVSIRPCGERCWHLSGVCTDITVLKSTEEALNHTLTGAHCILWSAHIHRYPLPEGNPLLRQIAHEQGTEAQGLYFDWKISLFAEDSVRRWLSVPCAPDQDYANALYMALLPEDRRLSERRSTDALLHGQPGYTQELRIQTSTGETRWLLEDVQLNALGPGHWHAVGINLDITERKASEVQLAHQARHDPLTGLANRRYLLEVLGQLQVGVLGLLFVDLDNFKLINDNFGHQVGDQVLIGVSERLRKTVAGRGLVARLGGDEFTVLLPYLQQVGEAEAVAEQVRRALGQPLQLPDRQLLASASVGVAFADLNAMPAQDLLRNANTAMHRAKGQGKGTIRLFDPQMDAEARDRFELESALRNAIQNQEILPYYQPILSLKTGEIIGVEALARWHRPNGNFIPPARFIPIAEETGLILPLGASLLRRACEDTVRWREQFPPLNLRVNVNVSGYQFHDPAFLEQVGRTLRETGLPAQALKLELTESVLLQDAEGCLKKLQCLAELGIRLALDDFGTGYSSLSYLSRLPVHALKIDRSFVRDLMSDDPKVATQNEEIVRAIIALGQALGLNVTAEGIEQHFQEERLRTIGARYAQGYLFAPPVPAAALTRYLEQKTTPALRRAA